MKHSNRKKSQIILLTLFALLTHQIACQDLPSWIAEVTPVSLEFSGQINEAEAVIESKGHVTQEQYLMKNLYRIFTDGTYISGFIGRWTPKPTDWPSFNVGNHDITFGTTELDALVTG